LELLTGLRRPLTGEVMWKGVSIKENNVNFTEELLYINHRLGMKSALTPIENLYLEVIRRNLIPTQPKQKVFQVIYSLLEQVNLKQCAKRVLAQLSLGQQRRLSLARLLLIKADCWILDEPFTSLDKQGTQLLISLMENQSKRGGIIIFTSHPIAHSFNRKIKKIFLDQ
ncbi:heme ABC exporter, ATP-binding protein CcmA, partial [Rickettsiella grylli]|uniref:heme ABC exporter ATP-binding protein CcmA n=1 Tax=Rickettsiella grylli TaxID=59196 RepID=UPI0008FD1438